MFQKNGRNKKILEKEQKTNNKKLMMIPNAVHTDLYDNLNVIPFTEIDEFFKEYLK